MRPHRTPSRVAIWTALGTVYVVWGSTYLAIAIAVQTLPPLLSAGIRFLAAGVILCAWLVLRGANLRVSARELRGAAVVGFLLLASGNGMVMLGERTVPSGLSALIVASVPLWIVVYRRVAGESIGRDLLAGVLLVLVGVAILVVPGGLSGAIAPTGALILFIATLSWALGTFLSPRLGQPRNVLVATAYQMLAGGAALTIGAAIVGEASRLDPSTFSLRSIVALLYLIAFGSLVGFTAYTWLLQHAPISLVSTYAYVNPVVAVVLGAVVLSEPVTPTTIAGAAVIVAAVAFIVTRQRAGARHAIREPLADAAK